MSKLIWTYQYIGTGEEITIEDDINIIPDKFNRWQIRGSLLVSTEIMTKFQWVGETVYIPFCYIEQRGCKGSTLLDSGSKFGCRFTHVHGPNLGYGEWLFSGETPNEVMIQVQESLDFIKLVLNNS